MHCVTNCISVLYPRSGASTAIFASFCARPTVQSGTRPRSWTVRATINPSWKQLSPRWNPPQGQQQRGGVGDSPGGGRSSPFNELDLFITGTDIDGRVSTQFDDAGHPIDVKDHRALFVLKHRQGRKEPFAPGETTWKALAKLARITSCFPAAFAPVMVGREAVEKDIDALLQQWGALEDKERCFDGGVLDNKPFTYTTKAIFSRTADREVERKLFYVEPDPESFARPERASNPNLVQAVLASLIGIPGYESITEDLRLLAEHNSRLRSTTGWSPISSPSTLQCRHRPRRRRAQLWN